MTKTGIVGIIVGIAGFGYAVYNQHIMNVLATKIDMTIDDLVKSTNVNISESMLNAAAEKAVDKEVSILAHKAAIATLIEISTNMNKEVKQAVTSEYENISKSVTDKITEEVTKLDQEALKKSITKKAEQKIVEKFDGSLDDIAHTFTNQLNNIGSVYSSLAGTMTKLNR